PPSALFPYTTLFRSLFRGQGVIAGSANFTYGGLVHNRELAIAQYQPSVVAAAEAWFAALWNDADDYRERLIEIITAREAETWTPDRKSTRLNSSHQI